MGMALAFHHAIIARIKLGKRTKCSTYTPTVVQTHDSGADETSSIDNQYCRAKFA
jgi:hypothetical protein